MSFIKMWKFSIIVFIFAMSTGSVLCVDTSDFFEPLISTDREDVRAYLAERILKIMNRSVDPCQNFYEYACGNYNKYVSESDELTIRTEMNNKLLVKILDSPPSHPENDAERKARTFYNTCVTDFPYIESLKKSVSAFSSLLDTYLEDDHFDWIAVEANLALQDINIFLKYEHTDLARLNPAEIPYLWTNLSLSNYAAKMKDTLKVLALPPEHVQKMVDTLYEFESGLGELFNEDSEVKNVTIEELKIIVPSIDFERYFSLIYGMHLNVTEYVEIGDLDYMKKLCDFLSSANSTSIYTYSYWRFVQTLISRLDQLKSESEELNSNCATFTNHYFKSAAMSLFVKYYINMESINDLVDMTERLQEELRKMFNSSIWLDQSTKNEALKKINNIRKHYGFRSPVTLEPKLEFEYQYIHMDPSDFVKNLLNASYHTTDIFADKHYTYLTTDDPNIVWLVKDSLEVNAYFVQSEKGHLFIPPGLVMDPFYHIHFPRYRNYGIVGSAVGHEFMHGFDTEGIKYDSEGVLRDWWTPRLSPKFIRNAQCYYSQYNKDHNIDGLSTLGENLPDNVGLTLAFNAYRQWLTDNENSTEIEMDGFSELEMDTDQAFFLSYAQFYCEHIKDEEHNIFLELLRSIDPHTSNKIRVLAVLANSNGFSRAFNCPVGSQMNRRKKCKYISA